ncbi:MAG: hypothetical protein JWM64_112 [Frankiales bacterium]|nr:hypothetical protein [Frankiales bacterium]
MNKKILSSVLTIGAVSAVVAGGGTWASWSDYDTNVGNTTGAGVLKIALGTTTPLFNDVKMAPGGSGEKIVEVVSNAGDSTPAGTLKVSLSNLTNREDGCSSRTETDLGGCAYSDTSGDFANEAKVTIKAWRQLPNLLGGQASCTSVANVAADLVGTAVVDTTLAAAPALNAVSLPLPGSVVPLRLANVIAPGDKVCVSTTVNLPQGATNESQGDSSSFDVRFDLLQATSANALVNTVLSGDADQG